MPSCTESSQHPTGPSHILQLLLHQRPSSFPCSSLHGSGLVGSVRNTINDWSWLVPATLCTAGCKGNTARHTSAGRYFKAEFLEKGPRYPSQQTGIPNAFSSTEFQVVIEVVATNFLNCPASLISKRRAAHDVMMARCIHVKAIGSKTTTPFSDDFPFQIADGFIPRAINWTEAVQGRREVASLACSLCCSDQVPVCQSANPGLRKAVDRKSRRELMK